MTQIPEMEARPEMLGAGPNSSQTLFLRGSVIDGTGAPARECGILIDGGTIAEVSASLAAENYPHAHVIDLSGKFVIPGLMDANVHLLLDYGPDTLLRYPPGAYDDLIVEAAQIALRAGITTVFDTWGPLEALRRVRARIDSGATVGSRIYFAGNIVGNGGPWSDDFMPSWGAAIRPETVEEVNAHWERGVGGDLPWRPVEDIRSAVRAYVQESGIDFLKYASSTHATVKFLTFSSAAQRAIVEEAHVHGLTAQACTMSPQALDAAIDAGVDLLQHGDITGRYPMPPETLQLIVERRLPCVALLMTERHTHALATEPRVGPGAIMSEIVLPKDENDRALIRAGAKLLLATDGGILRGSPADRAGLPDSPLDLGKSHLLWFKAAIERGMQPMAALLAATRNIADAYGKAHEIGTLEAGKRADLVVLSDNPLLDSAHYGAIEAVMKDGTIIDRAALPEKPVMTAGRP